MPQVQRPSTMPGQLEQKQGCCNVSHDFGQAFFSRKSLHCRSRIPHTYSASALPIAGRVVGWMCANALGSDSSRRLSLEWGTIGRASEKLSESGLPMEKGSISEWDASAARGVSLAFRVGLIPSNRYQLNIMRSDSDVTPSLPRNHQIARRQIQPGHCRVQLPWPAFRG
jgi:hypothetical protein